MAAKLHLFYSCILLVTFVAETSLGCKRSSSDSSSANVYSCGICGEPITIDLIIKNQLKSPQFEYRVTVNAKPQRELIYFLETAATMDPHFKFSTDFHGSLGHLVTKLNGLEGSDSDKTFWAVFEYPSGNFLNLGVSSYVPQDTQTVMFNFTTWDNTNS